jgi:hypothetical protein
MKIRNAVERIVKNLLDLDDMTRKLEELNSSNKEASQKLDAIEKRMIESTRAVATLALVQANLIKELGDIANNIEEKESSASKSYVRKTSTDFTN